MFIVDIFSIASKWKQQVGGPSIDEWNMKVTYIYALEFHSTVKKIKIKLFR